MIELPKKFPEYSIMYKALKKRIQYLENKKIEPCDRFYVKEIENKIEKYQKEIEKIKSTFPENFFRET